MKRETAEQPKPGRLEQIINDLLAELQRRERGRAEKADDAPRHFIARDERLASRKITGSEQEPRS